jgi:threonine aldolase
MSLENTHNIWGGAVLDTGYMKSVHEIARQHHLHLHLDGARVFNAAHALKVAAKEICQNCDSVMFCLSKGLAAPIGSILAGSEEFIKEARKVRKYLGGGMRQVGVIAAAGIISLEKMIERLEEDHRRAKKLAEAISDIREIGVNPDLTETNFVMINLKTMDSLSFLNRLKQKKVLALPYTDHLVRFVTHKDIDDQDVNAAATAIREIF